MRKRKNIKGQIKNLNVDGTPEYEDIQLQPGDQMGGIVEETSPGGLWDEDEYDEAVEKEINDNYLLDKNMFIDFKKIKKVSFTDEVCKKLSFGDMEKFFEMNIDEATLYADSTWDFLRYKYAKFYGVVPDTVRVEGIKSKKFLEKLMESFEINPKCYNKTMSKTIKDETCLLSFYMHFNEMLLTFEGGNSVTVFYQRQYEKDLESPLYVLLGLLKGFREPVVSKNKIYVVYRSEQGFMKMGFNVKRVDVNLKENYNDDFLPISETIIKDLNNKKKTGLFILSGEPGTGKTSFIRFLTSKIKRDIIFISPDMVDQITDPSFIPFLMRNNDSVLIIEDAEPALHKRGSGGRTSAVSNILNLTDGLLSDCLNISIVCTFNIKSNDIDEALLRKGRLMMNYHFDKLNAEKSKILLAKNGYPDANVTGPMTLAEIYYYEKDNDPSKIIKPIRKIGF